MRPVRFKTPNEVVYRGPSPEVGDLYCERVERGVIRVVYQPTREEQAAIFKGGLVELVLWAEPIPAISLNAMEPGAVEVTGEVPYRVISELDDEERHADDR